MRAPKNFQLINQVIIFFMVLLFVYTGVSKLGDQKVFSIQLFDVPVLGEMRRFVAWFIPAIELFIASLLIFERTRLVGLYLFISLMALFTLYLGTMILFNKDLPCKCGGVIRNMGWGTHIIFNLFFLSLALLGLRLETRLRHQKQKRPQMKTVPG